MSKRIRLNDQRLRAEDRKRLRHLYKQGAVFVAHDSNGFGVAADTKDLLALRLRGEPPTRIYKITGSELVEAGELP